MQSKLLEEIKSKKGATMQELYEMVSEIEILTNCKGFDQRNPNHCYTLLDHILMSVKEGISLGLNDIALTALLFHDVGKVNTATMMENETLKYYGHAEESAKIFKEYVTSPQAKKFFTVDDNDIRAIEFLLSKHELQRLSAKTCKKYLDEYGEDLTYMLIDIKTCDIKAQSELNRQEKLDTVNANEQLIDDVIEARKNTIILSIKGGDLIKIGIEPGPKLRGILDALTKEVKDGVLENTKEILLDYAKKKFISMAVKKFG